MSSQAKLTDTQLRLLSAASQREDHSLEAPKKLKGGAAQKVAAKVVAAGLVREVKAKTGMAIWRRDEETGQPYSLKLTAAGLKAIAVDEGDSQRGVSAAASPKAKKAAKMAAAPNPTPAPLSPAPRQGTKIADVIALLQRDQGAKLDELIAATGWLPHTARAALTGLRHRGYDVRLERGEKGQASIYRAFATPAMAP
jgi:hypothetical protein